MTNLKTFIVTLAIASAIASVIGGGCLENGTVSLPESTTTFTKEDVLQQQLLLTDFRGGVYTHDGILIENAKVDADGLIIIKNKQTGKEEKLPNFMLNEKTGEIVPLFNLFFNPSTLQLFYHQDDKDVCVGTFAENFAAPFFNGRTMANTDLLGIEADKIITRTDMEDNGLITRTDLLDYLKDHNLITRTDIRIIVNDPVRSLIASLITTTDSAEDVTAAFNFIIDPSEDIAGNINQYTKARARNSVNDSDEIGLFDKNFKVICLRSTLEESGQLSIPIASDARLIAERDHKRYYDCHMTFAVGDIASMAIGLQYIGESSKYPKDKLILYGQLRFLHLDRNLALIRIRDNNIFTETPIAREDLFFDLPKVSHLSDFDIEDLSLNYDSDNNGIFEIFSNESATINEKRIYLIKNFQREKN